MESTYIPIPLPNLHSSILLRMLVIQILIPAKAIKRISLLRTRQRENQNGEKITWYFAIAKMNNEKKKVFGRRKNEINMTLY